MLKLSEIISKPVVALYEGIKIGYVKNACLDEKLKKVKGFIIFDDDNDGSESFISSKDIFKVGEDAVLIKNIQKVINSLVEDNSPMNMSAYSADGFYAGEINDVNLGEELEVLYLSTNSGVNIEVDKVIKLGVNTLIYANENDIKISGMKPKTRKAKTTQLENIKVSILEIGDPKILEYKNEQNKKILVPTRITSNTNFLLGRKASKSIIGMNNEIIVKKGQNITEKIIQQVKQHNKINELAHAVEIG